MKEIRQISDVSSDLPDNLVDKLKAQKNLTQKHSGDWINNSPQDSAKTLYWMIEADRFTHIVAPDHDWIEEKLWPDGDKIQFGHKFVHVKGLYKIVEENFPDDGVHEGNDKEDLKDIAKKYPNGIAKEHMPENIVEEYEKMMESAKKNPSIGCRPSVFSGIMGIEQREGGATIGKKRIIWEESPHDVIEENLTMFFSDIIDVMDDLDLNYNNSFEKNMEKMAKTFKKETKKADETDIGKWELARRRDLVHKLSIYTNIQHDCFEKVWNWNQKALAGDISAAITRGDMEKANDLNRLRQSLKTLNQMSTRSRFVSNVDPKAAWNSGNDPSAGESPFSGSKSYLTTFQRNDEYLADMEQQVIYNFAEAIPQLFHEDLPVDGVDERIRKTTLRHIKGSYNKNRMKKGGAKISKIRSAKKIHETVYDKDDIATVSYKADDLDKLAHWNAVKGWDFEGEVLQVVGATRLSPIQMAVSHLKFFGTFPDSDHIERNDDGEINILNHINEQRTLTGFEDENLNLVYAHHTIGELLDALDRMRKQDEETGIIEKYGFIPEQAKKQFPEVETYERFTDYFHEKLIHEIEGEIPELDYDGNQEKMPVGFYKNSRYGLRRSKDIDEDLMNLEYPISREKAAEKIGRSERTVRKYAKRNTMINHNSISGHGTVLTRNEWPDISDFFA